MVKQIIRNVEGNCGDDAILFFRMDISGSIGKLFPYIYTRDHEISDLNPLLPEAFYSLNFEI